MRRFTLFQSVMYFVLLLFLTGELIIIDGFVDRLAEDVTPEGLVLLTAHTILAFAMVEVIAQGVKLWVDEQELAKDVARLKAEAFFLEVERQQQTKERPDEGDQT